jgi:hypothetical protein
VTKIKAADIVLFCTPIWWGGPLDRHGRTPGGSAPVRSAARAPGARVQCRRGRSRPRRARHRGCAPNPKSSEYRDDVPRPATVGTTTASGRRLGRGLRGRPRTAAAGRGAPTNKGDPVAEPGRTAVAVKEAIERAALRRIGLSEGIHQAFVSSRSSRHAPNRFRQRETSFGTRMSLADRRAQTRRDITCRNPVTNAEKSWKSEGFSTPRSAHQPRVR